MIDSNIRMCPVSEEDYGDFALNRLVLAWRFQRGTIEQANTMSWEYPHKTRASAVITSSHSPPRRVSTGQNHGSPPRKGLEVLHPTRVQFR